jgi:hypothetical protein
VSAYQCGLCGDAYDDIPHVCWLARHEQQTLPPEPVVGDATGEYPDDDKVPARLKRLDMSSL